MADELRGKFLYDIATAQVATQAADVTALAGRAKDLLGVATLTTTITGVIANDKLVNVTKHALSLPTLLLLLVGLALVVIAGFVALKPREWYLSPELSIVAQAVSDEPTWPVDAYYAQVAAGFFNPSALPGGHTAIEHNADKIRLMRRCVLIQLGGLSLLGAAGIVLAAQAI